MPERRATNPSACYSLIGSAGSTTPPRRAGEVQVVYTQDRATYRERQEGALTHTANPLDVAITGDRILTVATPRGPRLTRAGKFELMPDGTIADASGNALLNVNGRPMQVSPADTQISIAGDGTLSSENGQIGKIGVVHPDDPMRLQAEGAQLFRLDGATAIVASPKLVQGALEQSNVQPVLELIPVRVGADSPGDSQRAEVPIRSRQASSRRTEATDGRSSDGHTNRPLGCGASIDCRQVPGRGAGSPTPGACVGSG